MIELTGMEIINKLKNSVINLLQAKPKLFDIYPNYEKALEGGLGYDEKKLVEVIVAKALAFKKDLSTNNNLDLSISRTVFALSLLYKKSSLTILDFGGGAGTHYTLAKKLLGDKSYLDQILLDGVEKANLIASKKIERIKEIVGF